MTLFAVLPEIVVMRILVTGCAIIVLQPGKVLELLLIHILYPVAFDAVDLFVLSGERVLCLAMIKIRCRFKEIIVMTFQAV